MLVVIVLPVVLLASGCEREPKRQAGIPPREQAGEKTDATPGSPLSSPSSDDREPRKPRFSGGRLPERAQRLCDKRPPLANACPQVVPLVQGTYLVDFFGRAGGRFEVLELAAGAPRRDPRRNAPPKMAHVVIETGRPGFVIDLGAPVASSTPLEQLIAQDRDSAVELRHGAWPGRRLVLAESFPAGGAHGDHLMYRWKRRGYIHVVSLHVWSPVRQTVRTLREMVRSIPE